MRREAVIRRPGVLPSFGRKGGDRVEEKRVVEEDRVLEVPVTDEQIRVERRIVDRPVGAETQAFEEITIDVPMTTEQVELQKQARVAEEIVVSKEATQRTERVSGTVRREEVYVDEDATLTDDTEGRSARPLR